MAPSSCCILRPRAPNGHIFLMSSVEEVPEKKVQAKTSPSWFALCTYKLGKNTQAERYIVGTCPSVATFVFTKDICISEQLGLHIR